MWHWNAAMSLNCHPPCIHTLQCDFIVLAIKKVGYIPSPLDFGFGHCNFGGGLDMSKGLQSACQIRLGLSHPCHRWEKTWLVPGGRGTCGVEPLSLAEPSLFQPTYCGQGKLSPGGHWGMVPGSGGGVMTELGSDPISVQSTAHRESAKSHKKGTRAWTPQFQRPFL